ncbi:MAG: cysteine desulfurase, partial [Sphingomonas bacterium]|nr:cysteine desulfurase [Sphingomonas bacterium]
NANPPWLERASALRARLEQGVIAAGGQVVAGDAPRLATIGSYRLPGVPAASQLIRLDMAGIAVSAGSACSSGSVRPSHVLAAMGWDEASAREVIRVSFGPDTGEAEVEAFLGAWTAIAGDARARAA